MLRRSLDCLSGNVLEKKREAGPALLALISQGASTPFLFFQSNGIHIPHDDDLYPGEVGQYGRFVIPGREHAVWLWISDRQEGGKSRRWPAELGLDDLVADGVTNEFTDCM